MKIWKTAVLFYLGGTAYMTLEFLWRGFSHGSMFLLGGLCFLLLGQLHRRWEKGSMALKVMVGALLITVLELGTGLLVNRDYGIWDYRGLPYNFLGQISLVFSLLWMPVSLMGMRLYEKAERQVMRVW